jgi:hypothetical protein
MAVKFNKEMLLKQRFWILVSVTACLTLFGIFYLQLYGGEETAKATKAFKAIAKEGKDTIGNNNPTTIAKWTEIEEDARKKESIIWSAAYKEQADMFRWAPKIEANFNFLNGKFANDIKIAKLVDEKSWPEDKEFVAHGKLIDFQDDYFKVRTRKGEEKFFRMEVLPITDTDASKPVNWGNEFRQHLGKLLTIQYQTGKYFNDKLLDAEQDLFEETYKDQIHDVLKTVDPVDDKGNGVVQLKNWPYNSEKLPDTKDGAKFIRYVTQKWEVKNKFSKEAWIAMEDIWIQKEIYQIVKRANDDISKFKGVGGEQKEKVYNFKNANFALELFLKNDSTLSFKITNLLQRRQKLDLNFRVQMNTTGPPPVFRISGLPLAPAASYTQLIPLAADGKEFARKGIYRVEQLLTWETAAVKRIDQISIGSIAADDTSLSHRNFPDGLRPFDEKDMPKKEEAKGNDNMGKGPPGGDKGGFNRGDGAGANKTTLPHGLWTDRYVEVSEQSRRLPVAVVLVVDQDHVDRVITQFNNSKLRFLESQVLLNHFAGSLQPATAVEQKKEGSAPPFGQPGGFKGFGGSGFKGFDGGAAHEAQPAAAVGDDQETNMEMVIYGIVTLYQRFPPRPQGENKQ